jgi:hypothetical protein
MTSIDKLLKVFNKEMTNTNAEIIPENYYVKINDENTRERILNRHKHKCTNCSQAIDNLDVYVHNIEEKDPLFLTFCKSCREENMELVKEEIANLNNNYSKQPSEELLKLINELKSNILNFKDVFTRVVNKAKKEGFTDKEIDSLLYSKLKEVIPRKTLYRYREEFIPLAIDKRNKNIEQSSSRSGSNDTTNNEKDDPKEVIDERRNEINKQLPPEVVEKADEAGLSTNKRELLINKTLKKYPELQKTLIERIKDKEKTTEEVRITDNRARDIVHQTISDVEVGYLRPSETGKTFTYSGDPLNRDLIKGNKREAKEPYDYYRDSHDVIKKLLYLLTGYKKDEREYYTEDIINNTNNHRLDIVKSINSEFRELYGYDDKFIKPALMVLEDIHKKLNEEMDSAEQKEEMMKE